MLRGVVCVAVTLVVGFVLLAAAGAAGWWSPDDSSAIMIKPFELFGSVNSTASFGSCQQQLLLNRLTLLSAPQQKLLN